MDPLKRCSTAYDWNLALFTFYKYLDFKRRLSNGPKVIRTREEHCGALIFHFRIQITRKLPFDTGC